ncbi:Ig-like domain-containing protein [Gemmatimonas groenlandica]|uniref:BIG2 domain-containing protein n=1 Tax=Gemmatimonas groenlandica TaxID=2732249 RepID=A0A6M4IQF1_9BACT|nr:hypothetical protein [Gemmatimonas groenlandica]QJR36218.1 hypothetical protein HKW67_12220 [Gemmatimonas groenlandica]
MLVEPLSRPGGQVVRFWSFNRMILELTAVVLLCACADGATVNEPASAQAEAVNIDASAMVRQQAAIAIGEQRTLWVSPSLKSKSRSTVQPSWRSSNPAIASIVPQANGGQYAVVTGLANGAVYVIARTPAAVDSFLVIVGTGPAALRFAASTFALTRGDTARIIPLDTGSTLSYSSLSSSVATVTTSGLITALASGEAKIRVSSELGASGEISVTVSATVVPPPPVGGNRIVAALTRISVGSGSALVSSGVPLVAGALRDTDVSAVRVFVGGVEQRIFVAALQGRHPDGSLTSILLQFPYALASGIPVAAEIVLGSSRTLGDLPPQVNNPGMPDAVILPTDPNYLVQTDLVGATRSVESTSAISSFASKYDADFRTFADLHWATYSDQWEQNYYDRAQVYYAQWVRTGNPEYWTRGTRQVLAYRKGYLEPNAYGTSPHWSQIDGVALHYQLTGDEMSRFAVGRVAEVLRYFRDNARIVGHPDIDSRILARTLAAQLWSWRLQARGNEAIATAAEISTFVSTVLGLQAADGAWRYPIICAPLSAGLTYMDGMLNESLIQAYIHHSPNPAILAKVRKSADYMWSRWKVASQAVEYAPGCPPNSTDPDSYPELNNLVVNSYAWIYAQTGDVVFRQRADSLFNGGVRGQFLYGQKQFNQQYTTSYRYFFWRSAR